MKKRAALLLTIAACGILTGCGNAETPDLAETPVATEEPTVVEAPEEVPVMEEPPAEEATPTPLTAAGTEADLAILAALAERDPGENIVFSPISLNTAMATYQSLLDDQAAIGALDSYFGEKNYLTYQYPDETTYRSVNVIWADTGKEALNFDTAPEGLTIKWVDMSDPASTKEKDAFVSQATDGFLQSTPVVFNDRTVMDIMNVLYFHDTWNRGDLDLFYDRLEFTNADGSKTSLPYMIGREYDGSCYYDGSVSTAMGLNYENGMAFWAILPDEDTFDYEGLASDISGYLNGENAVWESESGAELNVYFEMPEFEIEYNTAFEGTDIPGLISFPISETICPYETANAINQIAKIKVDKEGTTAAAVTEITLEATAIMEPKPVEDYYFICDRPFLYLIFDRENDDIAFLGVINKLN